jgi:chromosome segregation ATPase
LLLLTPLLLATSAPVQPQGETLDRVLQRARAEQGSAEIEARRLGQVAAKARSEVDRLRAKQAAAAQAIEAAEARITGADANLRLVSAAAALRRSELQRQQQPIASLLSGLAMMARRPPLLRIGRQQHWHRRAGQSARAAGFHIARHPTTYRSRCRRSSPKNSD